MINITYVTLFVAELNLDIIAPATSQITYLRLTPPIRQAHYSVFTNTSLQHL